MFNSKLGELTRIFSFVLKILPVHFGTLISVAFPAHFLWHTVLFLLFAFPISPDLEMSDEEKRPEQRQAEGSPRWERKKRRTREGSRERGRNADNNSLYVG